ncbi:MAG: phosphatidylglycerophosphatase A [Bdellovibrionota bacterium]
MFFPRIVNQWIVTWFGCGKAPWAPGTAGSIGALPLCWLVAEHAPLAIRISVALGMTAIAILAAAQDQKTSSVFDPSYVVVDEVAGMLWSTLFISPTALSLFVAFVFFRIFDIVKPFPAKRFDRLSKTAPAWFQRGAFIILDDVFAGFYAAGATALFLHFFVGRI